MRSPSSPAILIGYEEARIREHLVRMGEAARTGNMGVFVDRKKRILKHLARIEKLKEQK
jgi:hypothetical protein